MALKQKTTIEIDVTRLNKDKFREFTRKDGTVAKMARLDVIELDTQEVVVNQEKQPVKFNDSVLKKVGFVAESQTKEERESGNKSTILGDATRWENTGEESVQEKFDSITSKGEDDINPADIPF